MANLEISFILSYLQKRDRNEYSTSKYKTKLYLIGCVCNVNTSQLWIHVGQHHLDIVQCVLSSRFVLSAVSPAVVVPSMLLLQKDGYGVEKGIPTLLMAAGSFDDILAITGFTTCLGMAFATGTSASSSSSSSSSPSSSSMNFFSFFFFF